MIRYDDWWIPLQSGLETYLKVPVIQAETTGEQPDFDFVSIKQTSAAIPTSKPYIVHTNPGEYNLISEYEMVLSITVHSDRIENATDIAQVARTYFNGVGYTRLSNSNLVVAELSNTTNRDTFITIEYERRMGFDLTLRYTDVDEVTGQDYIESLGVGLVAKDEVKVVDTEEDISIPFK